MNKMSKILIRGYKEEGDCDSCRHCGDSTELCVLRRCHRAIDELGDAYEYEETENDMKKTKAIRELIDFRDNALSPSTETINMAVDALMPKPFNKI